MGTTFQQSNKTRIMASHQWSLLEALGRNIHKFRRPTISDEFPIREGQEAVGSLHAIKLFDLQQRFETQLLMLVEKRATLENLQLFIPTDAQDLKVELNSLLQHLERALNATFQPGSSHKEFPAGTSGPRPRRASRLEHAIALLDASKGTIDITGSHTFALFKLSNLNDASNAHASVALVNGILQRSQSTTSVQAASRTKARVSRPNEVFTEKIQFFERISNERVRSLLDTIAKDFDDCETLTCHTAHAIRTQLLNYDSKDQMPQKCLNFCMYCPNAGDWQLARCEFETYVLLNPQISIDSNQPLDSFMNDLRITLDCVNTFRYHKVLLKT
jgi:hypothetical protein